MGPQLGSSGKVMEDIGSTESNLVVLKDGWSCTTKVIESDGQECNAWGWDNRGSAFDDAMGVSHLSTVHAQSIKREDLK